MNGEMHLVQYVNMYENSRKFTQNSQELRYEKFV